MPVYLPSIRMAKEKPTTPETSVRLGNVSASVFRNQTETNRDFRSVVFQRSYRDESGDLKFTNSFQVSDLPALKRVLELTQHQLEEIEAVIAATASR